LKIIRYNLALFSNGGNDEAKKAAVASGVFSVTIWKC
jgi:hypothetical protein